MTSTQSDRGWFILFTADPSRSSAYSRFYDSDADTGNLAPGLFIATASEAFEDMTKRSAGRWCGLLVDYATLSANRSMIDRFAETNPHAVLLVDAEGPSQVVDPPYEAVTLPTALDEWSGFLRRHIS